MTKKSATRDDLTDVLFTDHPFGSPTYERSVRRALSAYRKAEKKPREKRKPSPIGGPTRAEVKSVLADSPVWASRPIHEILDSRQLEAFFRNFNRIPTRQEAFVYRQGWRGGEHCEAMRVLGLGGHKHIGGKS